jgi:hypothetical protein
MSGIIRIKHIIDYKKVCYYSVIINQDDEPIEKAGSLFENFVKKQTVVNPEKLIHILSWLAEIGNKHGALDIILETNNKKELPWGFHLILRIDRQFTQKTV